MKAVNESPKELAFLVLRTIQFISISCMVVGFIWSTSDYLLLTILVDSPVTPLSVLLMLYGLVGTGAMQVVIKRIEKQIEKKSTTDGSG